MKTDIVERSSGWWVVDKSGTLAGPFLTPGEAVDWKPSKTDQQEDEESTPNLLHTVNVIELRDGVVQVGYAFFDSPEGNKKAEAQFKKCFFDHNGPEAKQPTEKDWEDMLDEGTYDDGLGYSIVIFHSV